MVLSLWTLIILYYKWSSKLGIFTTLVIDESKISIWLTLTRNPPSFNTFGLQFRRTNTTNHSTRAKSGPYSPNLTVCWGWPDQVSNKRTVMHVSFIFVPFVESRNRNFSCDWVLVQQSKWNIKPLLGKGDPSRALYTSWVS